MSNLEAPGQWDGEYGLRQTGIGRVSDYSPEEVEVWMKDAKLPPRLDGEIWFDWAQRTGERPLESAADDTSEQMEI